MTSIRRVNLPISPSWDLNLASKIMEELGREVGCKVIHDVDLSHLSRWQIGGKARYLIEPTSIKQLILIMRMLGKNSIPFLIIGTTSNILFDSRGFDGVLIKTDTCLKEFSIHGKLVQAESGLLITDFVRAAAKAGLGGVTHAAGIPGTIGGLVTMNGGTQRRGIGEHVKRVWISDISGNVRILGKDELKFSYRSSALKGTTSAILKVELELEDGDPDALLREIDSIIINRTQKFPEHLPNCGSTFLSDPAMYGIVGPPGRVLEEAGLKGLRRGHAEFSRQHANFIVNNGGASDNDVLWLISFARQAVKHKTGFLMDCEVLHLSLHGELRPAHDVADERWPSDGHEWEKKNA